MLSKFFLFLLGLCLSDSLIIKPCKRCIAFDECDALKNVLKLKSYSSQDYNFYNDVACGFDKFQPKVCCDVETIAKYGNNQSDVNKSENNLNDNLLYRHKNPNEDKDNESMALENYIGNSDQAIINESCDIRESKIVGGITAAIGLFPWMAKLGYVGSQMMLMKFDDVDENVVYRCGGSLITRRHVLTAAHCIVKLPQQMKLHVVVLDADGTPQTRRPSLLMSHPKYNSPVAHHDLGIIKLNEAVRYTENVMPICLPVGAVALNPSSLLPRSLMVAGWGSSVTGSKMLSNRLRYTRLTYLEEDECKSLFMRNYNLTLGGGHLCTVPDKERDACTGDSGGPLFAWAGDGSGPQAVILAVVSFGGKMCADKNVPAVFTRVDAYNDWIRDAISM